MDTTAVAMETTQTAGWPTQQEAAAALGVSTKTIQKYVQQGRLKQQMQSQINKPARAVIDPSGLERMVRERSQVSAEQPRNVSTAVLRTVSESLPEVLLEAFANRQTPLSELALKLYLTEDEAVRYTGLSASHLRIVSRGWEEGARRIGPRGATVYKRVELEAL